MTGVAGMRDWRADDIDPVAVERALHGKPVGRPLHPREKREIARRLGSLGELVRVLNVNMPAARKLWEEAEK